MAQSRHDLQLASRRGTYTLVIGVVVGMLAAGLGIPFLFGTSLDADGDAGSPLVARGVDEGSPSGVGDGASGATDAGVGGASGDGSIAGGAIGGGAGAVAGGSGSGVGRPLPTSPSGAAAPGVALTASDRGVTADSITLAFLLVDLGGVSQVGFSVPGFDPESQKGYVKAYVDDVNARGGVLGRKLVPKFFSYDPTDPSSGQAACREATQDHAIFAALDTGGGLDFPGQLCVTEQNKTPLIEFGGFGTTQEMYDKSAGRLVTILPSGVRSLANTAQELVRQGLLKGKRIGIVDRDFPGTAKTVTDGMVATLQRLGYKVTYRATFSMDNGIAASQVPLAVQQMRANQVDVVMLLTDFIIGTEFVQAAERSGWNPDYYVSDFESMTNDTAVSAMPGSFRAVGITTMRTGEWRINAPEQSVDASCRKRYAASSGTDPKRSDNAYGGALLTCGMVDVFVRAALLAGPELTRARWVTAVQQIGALPFPNFGGMSFGPGKVDGADHIRTIVFDAACPSPDGGTQPCWKPTSGFKPPHY